MSREKFCEGGITLTRNERPPAPGTDAYEQRLAFANLVLSVEDLLDPNGAMKPGAQAIIVQRFHYDRLFMASITDPDNIWFYTDSNVSLENIKELYHAYAPAALRVTCLLQHFPRHRWTGADTVTKKLALFSGTNNLLYRCGVQWLMISIAVPRPVAGGTTAGLEFDLESLEGSGEEDDTLVVANNDAGDSHRIDHSDRSAEFFKGENNKAKNFITSDPKTVALLLANIHHGLDQLLRYKLYLHGESWMRVRMTLPPQKVKRGVTGLLKQDQTELNVRVACACCG